MFDLRAIQLEFDNEVLESDIVIFGLGSIRWNHPVTGFMRHVYNLRLQSFLNNFDIVGEIAFAPFSKKGFLFHHLLMANVAENHY